MVGFWGQATLLVIGYLFSGLHVSISMPVVVVGYRRDRAGETSRRYAGMDSYFSLGCGLSQGGKCFANVIAGPEDAGHERDCISSALV